MWFLICFVFVGWSDEAMNCEWPAQGMAKSGHVTNIVAEKEGEEDLE